MKTKLLCLLSAFAALSSLRAQDPTVLYGDWSEKNTYRWTDAEGNAVSWTAGSIAHVKAQYNGNSGAGGFNVYGFIFDYSGCLGYWTDGNTSTVGAGGIEFLSDGTYAVGRNSYTDIRFELSASQSWKGPSDIRDTAITGRCRSSLPTLLKTLIYPAVSTCGFLRRRTISPGLK